MSRAIGKHAVLIICVAQLFGTSLWFSANAVTAALGQEWHVTVADIGWLTSAVQLGFILGTLALATTGLPDRFRASRIFAAAAVAGAAANIAFAWLADNVAVATFYRLLVGIALAGVYPVGMKLVVSWAPQRAGAALAKLVGMLTLGTALPHLLHLAGGGVSWRIVVSMSSLLALIAAAMVLALGDGERLTPSGPIRFGSIFTAFRIPAFRSAATGYFGHMWELYAFWTLVPFLVMRTLSDAATSSDVSAWSFAIIGIGAVACLLGGALSHRRGSAWVARNALLISGACCLAFPLLARWAPAGVVLCLLLLWGASVIADSPQFSALCAASCPPGQVGSALAIMNCIGFAISTVSIAMATHLVESMGDRVAWLLLAGPVLGLIGFSAFRAKVA